ncbi:hypothetical protein AOL_s00043g760 [Orbilia oligospora ATCC 24927]|uniref:Diphthine--ammonia ligase n=1 Tax=Arthrobotrys oligospora (strain ATCC 24927 / CBS 115.81 / DSM 1491) TaxID=756982 RepID=G1X4Y6_ARTOA|nr:hypothetical protein AOL_s00043g760 [Orbilia oligospora ATCC 24927]EGX51741.1 hypothetical protein AOL_s00043g760 [Orbilia oligospora ATCC 24927]
MAASIPTVALISGGKDSFFSLLHSNANGFQVIALANLHPPVVSSSQTSDHDDSDDLNSFMYQTVGHTVLPHYSSILNIPLYRAAITGSSVNQDLSYHPNATASVNGGKQEENEEVDEIENLYDLLHSIKLKHPELRAVCSGAILSSYQRTRVESVCQRLGLISIAWLWQRKQERVLREMDVVGLDARIIKVASLGLDERWLGRSVADFKTRMALENIKKKYGGNVAGEGGEFETLVMGCKGWGKKVEVLESEIVNEGGGVAWTKFLETKIVDAEHEEMTVPEKPPPLDGEFEAVFEYVKEIEPSIRDKIQSPTHHAATEPFRTTAQVSPHNIYIANLHSVIGGIAEQVNSIFSQLQERLSKSSSTLRQITSTLLLLRSMDDFQEINKVYSSYFTGFPNPPSRVCVAIGDSMPGDIGVLLSVVVDMPEPGDKRQALHVQSRSYWVPANVGPYSQVIAVGGVVSVAGMIGLVPESMKVWESEGVRGETVLALQSMVRVGREMNIHGKCGWLGGVGFVVDDKDVGVMKGAWKKWFEGLNEEDDGELDQDVDESYFEKSDQDITSPVSSGVFTSPPLVIVQVPQLPVGSHVEFACQGVDSTFLTRAAAAAADEDDEDDEEDTTALAQNPSTLQIETDSSKPHGNSFQYHSVSFGLQQLIWGVSDEEGGDLDQLKTLATRMVTLQKAGYKSVSVTLYLSTDLWAHADSLIRHLADVGLPGVCCVPIFGVWWAADDDVKKQWEYRVGFTIRAVKG